MLGGKSSKTLNKYTRNLIDEILKSRGFGELKNGGKGEKKHSCEVTPSLFFSLRWMQKNAHECESEESGVAGKRAHTQDECLNESGSERKTVSSMFMCQQLLDHQIIVVRGGKPPPSC